MLSSARISHLLVAGALLATQGMAMDDPGTGEPGQTEFEDAGGVGNWDSTSSTTDPEGSQMESMGSDGETPLAGPPVPGDAGGEGPGGEGAGDAFAGDSEGGMPAVAPSSGPSSGHASNGNFGEWNFKSPSSSVYKVDGSQYCGAGTEWNGSHCIVTYDSFIRGCSQNSNGKWKCTVQKAQDCNGD